MTENSVTEIPIASIRMTGRYRKDHGDIATLASSIEQLGLLQPIGVTASNELVFGQRRVLAFQRLGRSTIPARVIDVPALVLAEHAENEIRKDFTTLERVAIGEAVEAELGKRQGQRTDLASERQSELVENFPQVESGQKTRQVAAEKAGFGNETTYRQAKAVAHHAAPELAQAMDQGHVAISTAARLVSAPMEVQRKAAADPKKAVELAKSASQQKSTEIKAAAVAIQKREMQTEMAEMRALRPARAESTPSKESAPHPKDPVFDTVLPNGRNIANGDPKALWLWGWMLEYEDRFLREAPTPEELTSNFLDFMDLDFMDNDSIRLIPQITSYLNKVLESIHASKCVVDDSRGERMTAAQRNKGARGEREFCVLLSELGEKYFRQLGAARDGGPDVLIGERWAVEVKRAETPEFIAWWAQAFRQAMECGRFPALAYRASRQPWTVAVPLDVLLFGRVLWEDQGSHAPWCPWEFTAKLTIEGFATVVREII